MICDLIATFNIECNKQQYERFIMWRNKPADSWKWQETTQIIQNLLQFECCNVCGNVTEKITCDNKTHILYCDLYCHWQIKCKHINKSTHWKCKMCLFENKSQHLKKCVMCGHANATFVPFSC